MSHAYYHALSSTKRWGGRPEDYLAVHEFLDSTKIAHPDVRHRAVLHNSFGVFLVERVFGNTLTNADGRPVPTRLVAEQHVVEDLGRVPSLTEWLVNLTPRPWMDRPRRLSREFEPRPDPEDAEVLGRKTPDEKKKKPDDEGGLLGAVGDACAAAGHAVASLFTSSPADSSGSDGPPAGDSGGSDCGGGGGDGGGGGGGE